VTVLAVAAVVPNNSLNLVLPANTVCSDPPDPAAFPALTAVVVPPLTAI